MFTIKELVICILGALFMRKLTYLKVFLLSFLGVFLAFCFISVQNVKADIYYKNVDYTFNDGVKSWSKGSSSTMQLIKENNGLSIGYGFGLGQNNDGTVNTGAGDSTITKDSTFSNNYASSYSKMNVFLRTSDNKYISSTYQAAASSHVYKPEGVSLSSPDFMITPPGVFKKLYGPYASVLTSGSTKTGTSGNVTTGMHDKQYYFGEDSNGHKVFKIVGVLNRKADNYHYGTYNNLTVELLLRPSQTNSALVQREMYIRNNDADPATFQTFFGEDTSLGTPDDSFSYTQDAVPIYDLGNKHGIYIKNGSYKLNVTNETDDGFNNYMHLDIANTSNTSDWGEGFTSSGTGDETTSSPNKVLMNGGLGTNSAYSLRWNTVTLAQNQVAHFSSTIGEVQSPYALPSPKKTYTNETHPNGNNQVGDTLKFTLKMQNLGYNSSWAYNNVIDKLPAGLQYKDKSVQIDGAAYNANKVQYDPTTRSLSINPGKTLSDNDTSNITFEATITNDASGLTISNTADFYGRDLNVTPKPSTDSEYSDSVKIPVENTNFGYTFTKQIKKSSDTNYSDTISGQAGDIVDYKINFSALKNFDDIRGLASGATLTDNLPDGISLVPNSVSYSIDGTSQSTGGNSLQNLPLDSIAAGSTGSLTFQAKINKTSVGQLLNSATISNAKTDAGNSLGDMTSSVATLNVQDSESFLAVPNVDFGSVNMYGKSETLDNVSSTGGLRVAHPNSNKYSVNVSYDNTDANSQLKTATGNTLTNDNIATDGSGLIYIRQRTSKPTDVGKFVPILPGNGTAIQTDQFDDASSDKDLSKYVGIGDWQLRLGSGTKAGAYKGILTWSIKDAI